MLKMLMAILLLGLPLRAEDFSVTNGLVVGAGYLQSGSVEQSYVAEAHLHLFAYNGSIERRTWTGSQGTTQVVGYLGVGLPIAQIQAGLGSNNRAIRFRSNLSLYSLMHDGLTGGHWYYPESSVRPTVSPVFSIILEHNFSRKENIVGITVGALF